MCQGLVKSYAGLAACRFFIGFFEAGLLPGQSMSAMSQPESCKRTRFQTTVLLYVVLFFYGISGVGSMATRTSWRSLHVQVLLVPLTACPHSHCSSLIAHRSYPIPPQRVRLPPG